MTNRVVYFVVIVVFYWFILKFLFFVVVVALKGLYTLTQPQSDWRPVFDRTGENNSANMQQTSDLALQNQQTSQEDSDKQTAIAINNNNMISISIGVKYGESGPSTSLNFAFDPDCPQDILL